MKAAVIRFPGSNCDQDCYFALKNVFGIETDYVWHKESSLHGYDLVVLPGGFSYGDYLRCGAIARFSPIMKAVVDYANHDGLTLGICNGFQVLTESRLLPGALVRNRSLHFVCSHVNLKVIATDNPFLNATQPGQILNIPIAHGEGNYTADEATLKELQENNRILVRYCNAQGEITAAANPNGSLDNIAGICNAGRNVFGLMPHPERACETRLGSTDGNAIFRSILNHLGVRAAVA
jgi:phosphoribosylformylglycinamidine synthase subunit PurQ / glutaminase